MDWIRLLLIGITLIVTGCVSPSATETNSEDQPLVNAVVQPTKKSTTNKKQPAAPVSVWQQVNQQQSFHVPLNNRIKKEQDFYLSSPLHLYRLAERAEPYIYWIMGQLRQRNLPIELAFLPMVESGFNPAAVSSAKAAGLWQFIPLTAKEYGLSFNRWYDSRRSLFESTEAALNLLEYLNKQFDGDWLLTLAAYNAGEGRVRRAMQLNQTKQLPTHFWALRLPDETMAYVPRLLALVNIFSQPTQYQIALPQLDQVNQLHPLEVPIQLNLSKIAELSDLPVSSVRTYNAGHLLSITHPSKGSSVILLPKKNIDIFQRNLKQRFAVNASSIEFPTSDRQHPISTKITLQRYNNITEKEVSYFQKLNAKYKTELHRIKQGDSLYAIAKRYKVKLNDLLRWNSILDGNKIKPGMLLTIYTVN